MSELHKINEATKKPALALFLAFIPSVLALAIIAVGSYGLCDNWPDAVWPWVLVLVSAISFGCCLGGSFLLLRRKTRLAMIIGIIFLLLNAMISLFFGCATVCRPE
ncbi:MAG: hypothetical protein U1F83_07825 [Verrucomicrobiota bacterium]